jgi:hypothetical protein
MNRSYPGSLRRRLEVGACPGSLLRNQLTDGVSAAVIDLDTAAVHAAVYRQNQPPPSVHPAPPFDGTVPEP